MQFVTRLSETNTACTVIFDCESEWSLCLLLPSKSNVQLLLALALKASVWSTSVGARGGQLG